MTAYSPSSPTASFIESRTFDGFRKMVAQRIYEIWVVDLGGDVRANPKLSGTKHNVFGIQTGVAIAIWCGSRALRVAPSNMFGGPRMEDAEDKLSWSGCGGLNPPLIFGYTMYPTCRQ